MPEPRVAFYGYLLTEGLAWVARRRVDGEAAALRDRFPALDVLIFRPGREDRRAMAVNAMDGRRRDRVRRQAYESCLRTLDRADVRDTLARRGLERRNQH